MADPNAAEPTNEREADLGDLVVIMAHDLKNALAALTANLHFLDGSMSEVGDPETAEALSDSVTLCQVLDHFLRNLDLLGRLQRLLPDTRVGTTHDSGIDPDLVEAILFAWLARERIANRELDTRRITGAREPVLLGEIFDPA